MTKISMNNIFPNPDQPRTVFDQAELEGLAQSIKENGLIQPIVVEAESGKYILIDGERRLRACQLLEMTKIEAVITVAKVKSSKDRLTRALVANVQRSAMGPVDEARAYEQLEKELGSVEAVAQKLGVASGTIYTKRMLLGFPKIVQKIFNTKSLPVDPKLMARMKQLTTEQQVSVATIAATRQLSAKSLTLLIGKVLGKKKKYTFKTREAVAIEPVLVGKFNALALVKHWNKLPAPTIAATKETCRSCPLYSYANAQTCKNCALPTFLNNLEIPA